MKPSKNRGFLLFLAIAMLLAGCSSTDSTPDKTSGSTGNAVQESTDNPATEGQADNGLLADAVDYGFEKGGQITFDKEQDGYSCQVTVETWAGKQSGNEVVVFHPANPNIGIPLNASTDCVVPYAATVKVTTENADFLTDLRIGFKTEQDMNYGEYFSCRTTDTTDMERLLGQYETNNPPANTWNVWRNFWVEPNRRYSKAASGDEYQIYGYYAVSDAYSPTNPDGVFEPGDLTLLVGVGLGGDPAFPHVNLEWDVHTPAEVGVHCDAVIPIQITG